MIIRVDADEKEDEILVMEATTNSGVHLKNFSKMTVHLGGFYQKLALRHLDFKRTDEQMEILNQFMDEAIGREYKINLKQLIKPRETMSAFGQGGRPDPSENDGLLLDPNRKLFCSELVAKVFKCIGIMPTK